MPETPSTIFPSLPSLESLAPALAIGATLLNPQGAGRVGQALQGLAGLQLRRQRLEVQRQNARRLQEKLNFDRKQQQAAISALEQATGLNLPDQLAPADAKTVLDVLKGQVPLSFFAGQNGQVSPENVRVLQSVFPDLSRIGEFRDVQLPVMPPPSLPDQITELPLGQESVPTLPTVTVDATRLPPPQQFFLNPKARLDLFGRTQLKQALDEARTQRLAATAPQRQIPASQVQRELENLAQIQDVPESAIPSIVEPRTESQRQALVKALEKRGDVEGQKTAEERRQQFRLRRDQANQSFNLQLENIKQSGRVDLQDKRLLARQAAIVFNNMKQDERLQSRLALQQSQIEQQLKLQLEGLSQGQQRIDIQNALLELRRKRSSSGLIRAASTIEKLQIASVSEVLKNQLAQGKVSGTQLSNFISALGKAGDPNIIPVIDSIQELLTQSTQPDVVSAVRQALRNPKLDDKKALRIARVEIEDALARLEKGDPTVSKEDIVTASRLKDAAIPPDSPVDNFTKEIRQRLLAQGIVPEEATPKQVREILQGQFADELIKNFVVSGGIRPENAFDVALLENSLGKLQKIRQLLLVPNPDGSVRVNRDVLLGKVAPSFLSRLFPDVAKGATLKNIYESVRTSLLKLQSGAEVKESEIERAKLSFDPGLLETDEEIIRKINDLENIFETTLDLVDSTNFIRSFTNIVGTKGVLGLAFQQTSGVPRPTKPAKTGPRQQSKSARDIVNDAIKKIQGNP